MINKIIQRDGSTTPFDVQKITDAIFDAAEKVGGKDRELAAKIAEKVRLKLDETFTDEKIPTTANVHDTIERILVKDGFADTAKQYILARKEREEIINQQVLINTNQLVESYLNSSDWLVKENSNMTYSLQGLNTYITSDLTSRYWLQKVYSKDIRDAHSEGDMHIHDLQFLSAYCCGWDIEDLLLEGFAGVRGKVESGPPNHFSTALIQIVNYLYTLQNEAAGAQAVSNFDTYLAPFIRYDGLIYKEVKQALQQFVFNMNVPTRLGFQTPFSNVTLDLTCPDHMKNINVIINGERQKETYGEFQKEMDMFNKSFAEILAKGDASGRVFTFPIPTYNIYRGLDWNTEVMDKIMEMTAKYGIPYFANFINSDMKPEDVRSMCCRLRLNNRELRKKGGGLFGANPLTGSIGVVTINLPRIGYLSKTENEFFERLGKMIDIAKKSLDMKREKIEEFTLRGLYPYSQFYLRKVFKATGKYWSNHFSTIGIFGMNEALLNFMKKNISTKEGKAFALNVLEFMRNRLSDYQEEKGIMYNLEATPAEGVSYRFANIDKQKYPDIISANEEDYKKGVTPYYTNSTHLPVNFTDDIFEALELQEELQIKYTGGTVLHGFIGEEIPSGESTKLLIKKIAEHFKLPYYTITPTFSICKNHGYLKGKQETCPQCKEKCEVYSRVVGYIRPVEQWHSAKQAEFKDRKTYDKVLLKH